MTNFLNAFNNKQFFIHDLGKFIFEMPFISEAVPNDFVFWCSNLAFSDFQNNSSHIGFVGRCIIAILLVSNQGLFETHAHDVGGWKNRYENTFDFHGTTGVSCVYVEQTNIFECEFHDNSLSWQARFWDDGQENMSEVGWEAHSENDVETTWAWSGVGKLKWMSVDEAAMILNTTPAELNTDTFASVYEKVWTREFNETNAGDDDTTTTLNSNNTNNDDNTEDADANDTSAAAEEADANVDTSDTSTAAEEADANDTSDTSPAAEEDSDAEATDTVDDSNGGSATRKLASATNRVVSIVLSLFGI